MIQAARLDLNDGFIRTRLRVRDIAEFEFSGRAVGNELGGFHDLRITIYDLRALCTFVCCR